MTSLPSNSELRKLISKSLLSGVPNNFLKPKSVYGLMYLAPPISSTSCILRSVIVESFRGLLCKYKQLSEN